MAVIISASRRTDLARMFPAEFSGWLQQGWAEVRNPFSGHSRKVPLEPAGVHTMVLWSKDYTRLLANEAQLLDRLREFPQLYFHFTVTGLGGSRLEPGVPPARQTDRQWERLAEAAGDVRRIAWRFDPIVFWRDGQEVKSNLEYFPQIAQAVKQAGITQVTISLCQWYAKAQRRAVRYQIAYVEPTPLELGAQIGWLLEQAERFQLTIEACSCPRLSPFGIKPAKCIDGARLTMLHPVQEPAGITKDTGQRQDCGCIRSIDIGSYQLNCTEGCVYCYANPKIN